MKRIVLLCCCLLGLFACKSSFEKLLESGDRDEKYETAMDLFLAGKYLRAAQLFESLTLSVAGTPREDTVLYYWGLSNYRAKDYATAETNFEKFVESFPLSPFAESAAFMRLDCLSRSTYRYELDQTPTYRTITAISEYIIAHPDTRHMAECQAMLKELNDRLDKKAYENARLYYKMEDYKAARVAMKNILKDDADNIYREEILYYAAMSSYKYAQMSVREKQKERFLVFVDDYFNFVSEYPESSRRKELDALYAKVKK